MLSFRHILVDICRPGLNFFFNVRLFGGTGPQLQHVGSSSLTRDRTWAPALGAQSLNHWASREVPDLNFYHVSLCEYSIVYLSLCWWTVSIFSPKILLLECHLNVPLFTCARGY